MAQAREARGEAALHPDIGERKRWMGILTRAPREALEGAWADLGGQPGYEWLRKPEVGLVMVRGRAGGTGQPFNLGEMTVTRCAVRLADGTRGHAYIAGRDRRSAELAAVFDALMQQPEWREAVKRSVVDPLEAAQAERRGLRSRKAASTKVDFFTLVREGNPK
jgi:alpha-D-ribose 1-methylphosphonate 5-triphosphate synthase subunit PhnG